MTTSTKNRTAKINEYNKQNRSRYLLAFSNKYDKEVVKKLESVENKSDYVRQLILKDINS